MHKITLPAVFDAHLHLRDADLLRRVAPYSARFCDAAIAMPNLLPPIKTAEQAIGYRERIRAVSPCLNPLPILKLEADTTPETVREAKRAGIDRFKYYPPKVTHHSGDGTDFLHTDAFKPILDAMEEESMILCLHGEVPYGSILDAEEMFLDSLVYLVRHHPKLRIVFEHISSAIAVQSLLDLPELKHVVATVTAHHLVLTIDDVLNDKIHPHHFCKPVAKREQDRDMLRRVVTSGNPRFFFGSDSAPHEVPTKECAHGCSGIFSAPSAIEVLVTEFERMEALELLPKFLSAFGRTFYNLPEPTQTITLSREPWQVPDLVENLVPFYAGRTLPWKLAHPLDRV